MNKGGKQAKNLESIYYDKLFRPTQRTSWQDIIGLDPCCYCGSRRKQMTQEHVIPSADGGSDKWDNLVGACATCNRYRSRDGLLMCLIKPNEKLAGRWKEVGSPFLKG